VLAEFAPRPATGRIVTATRRVGLGDTRPDGRVRLDALARFFQDVADEDAVSAAVGAGAWVLRRLTVRVHRTPRFRANVTLSTWCSGSGPRWAERRTDMVVDDEMAVEAVALWVHVDPGRGVPTRLPREFASVWGTTAGGRRVSARLVHDAPPTHARREPWPLRAADLDVLGHVNNAAYFAPVEEELARRGAPRVGWAQIEFRSGIEPAEPVELRVADRDGGFALWLTVHEDVRASALVGSARPGGTSA